MTIALNRLLVEWQNRTEEDYVNKHGRKISMRTLEEKTLHLKRTMSYDENWKRLMLREMPRHAHDEDYVAALLYLVDDRRLPINKLQPLVGLWVGHIYRQFERAGVRVDAHTRSLGARIREPYFPFSGAVYIAPLAGKIVAFGEILDIPPGVEIYKNFNDEDEIQGEDREEVLGILDLPERKTPLPMLQSAQVEIKKRWIPPGSSKKKGKNAPLNLPPSLGRLPRPEDLWD